MVSTKNTYFEKTRSDAIQHLIQSPAGPQITSCRKSRLAVSQQPRVICFGSQAMNRSRMEKLYILAPRMSRRGDVRTRQRCRGERGGIVIKVRGIRDGGVILARLLEGHRRKSLHDGSGTRHELHVLGQVATNLLNARRAILESAIRPLPVGVLRAVAVAARILFGRKVDAIRGLRNVSVDIPPNKSTKSSNNDVVGGPRTN